MIRVPGEGDAPISGKGPKGDLLLRVNVAASKVFRRQGKNLHHEARIPMHTAYPGSHADGPVPPHGQPALPSGDDAPPLGRAVVQVQPPQVQRGGEELDAGRGDKLGDGGAVDHPSNAEPA